MDGSLAKTIEMNEAPEAASGFADRPSGLAGLEADGDHLIQQSRAGCLESFGLLVERHQPRIFNFLIRYTGNRHDAEDVTQDTFIQAYRHLDTFRSSQGKFLPWLFAIARHAAINHLRRRKPATPLAEPDHETWDGTADPASALAAKDEHRAIWNMARTLKPKEYETLWLRYGEGFAIAEIARIMKLNQIHVKVLLHRARNRLARKWTCHGLNQGVRL